MEQIISQLLASFSIELLFSLIIVTYLTLKIFDYFIKKSNKVIKHLVTALVALVLCIVFYLYADLTLKQIIPTYLLSTAFYDVIIKNLLDKLNMGYKYKSTNNEQKS